MKKFLYYLAFVAESLRFISPVKVPEAKFVEKKRRFCEKYYPLLSRKKTKKKVHRPQRR